MMKYIDRYYTKIQFLLPPIAQGKKVDWMIEKNEYDETYYNNSGETHSQWFHFKEEPFTQQELF